MTTTATTPKKRGWKSWLPKAIFTVLGLVAAYFIFAAMGQALGSFQQGWERALSVPTIWLVAIIVASVFAIAVYPLTAMAAIPGLGYGPAFVDRQGGFVIATGIPFGGGPIAVGTQYAILAKYDVPQKKAAAAVAADAVWTYLMTFGAPALGLIMLEVFERRSLQADECGPVSCHVIDWICIGAGIVCAVSVVAIAFVLRSQSNAEAVGRFAEGVVGGVFRFIKKTPPDIVGSVVGFNDTAAEMVGTRWKQLTLTNVLAQLSPLLVILAALWGVGAGSVTFIEAFTAYSVALLATTVPIAPGALGTVDAVLVALLVAFGAQSDQALAVDIIWRGFTFFPQMIVGACALLFFFVERRIASRRALSEQRTA